MNTADVQKKAQDAMVVVQKRLGEAVEMGKKVLGPVGEKAGSMLGCECLLYFSSVLVVFFRAHKFAVLVASVYVSLVMY